MPFGFDTILPQAAGNVLGAVTTKIQEATTSVVNSFGGNGPFTKVSAASQTLTSSGADAAALLAKIKKDNAGLEAANAAISSATASLKGALSINSMSAAQLVGTTGADLSVGTAAQINAGVQDQDDSHIVSLEEPGGASVFFRIMPEIAESRSVEYEPVAPPQSPGAFQKYKGTASTQWTVNATLTCRTTDEATENLRIINTLRGWTMPYFGENTKLDYPTKLGAPPPVLTFSGYRDQMVGPVPVVMTSVNWQFTTDVDYIPARAFSRADDTDSTLTYSGELIPFPTVMKVAIQLVESFSTEQFNGFSLADFRLGNFEKAFRALKGNGINDRNGRNIDSGGAAAAEPAQVVLPNELRGGNGYTPPPGAGAGRGVQGAPGFGEAEAYRLQVARDSIRGQRDYGVPITEVTTKIKSGGGGDFGGGGASGSF